MKEFIHQDWRTQESEFRQEVLGSVALRQEFIRLIHQEDGSGLTPVKTYDPERENPILFEAGDYIRFVPVSEEEYLKIKEQVENGTYECIIHTKEV